MAWNDFLKDYRMQGNVPLMMDYGAETLANKFNTALPNNQNNSGLQWWMNNDRSRYPSPIMPEMLDQSGQMGASNYQAPQLNTLDPNWQNQLAGYGTTMDRGNSDNTFLSNLKQKAKGFTTPVMSVLKGIKDQFEYRPATEEAWDPNTGQFVSAEEQDKMNALGGYYSDAAGNQRRQRARVINMIKRRDAGQKFGEKNLQRLIDLGYGPKETPPAQTDRQKIETYTGRPMSQYRQSRPASERSFTGHGKSGMGRSADRFAAEGGRIGYRNGEFVEDVNVEGPGFDVNENLMASDDNNTRILENLFDKYIDLGFSPQEAEKMAMDEFELMSQGPEQDQGLASLV